MEEQSIGLTLESTSAVGGVLSMAVSFTNTSFRVHDIIEITKNLARFSLLGFRNVAFIKQAANLTLSQSADSIKAIENQTAGSRFNHQERTVVKFESLITYDQLQRQDTNLMSILYRIKTPANSL